MKTLVEYSSLLIDRLLDLKTALTMIEHGAKDPRMVARAAIVADMQARQAMASAIDARLKTLDDKEDEVA